MRLNAGDRIRHYSDGRIIIAQAGNYMEISGDKYVIVYEGPNRQEGSAVFNGEFEKFIDETFTDRNWNPAPVEPQPTGEPSPSAQWDLTRKSDALHFYGSRQSLSDVQDRGRTDQDLILFLTLAVEEVFIPSGSEVLLGYDTVVINNAKYDQAVSFTFNGDGGTMIQLLTGDSAETGTQVFFGSVEEWVSSLPA